MFNKKFNITLFVILFLLLAFAATIVYSIGLSTGYQGTSSWSWDYYVQALSGLFGGLLTLFWIAVSIIAIGVGCLGAGWLAHRRYVVREIIWFLIWFIPGGFIVFRVVDWSGITLGWIPVVVLVVFTGLVVLIANLIATRFYFWAKEPEAEETDAPATPAAAQS